MLEHRQTDEAGVERSDYASGHEVVLATGSRLARCSADASPDQFDASPGGRDLGDGLVVAGRTSDGVIEAAEATFEHPYLFAVQWHPEELDDAPSRALFAGLAAAAAAGCPKVPFKTQYCARFRGRSDVAYYWRHVRRLRERLL